MNVGSFLHRTRIERGLSLREVSSAVDISPSSLCEYEKGLSDPPASKFFKLCDFYNVNLDLFSEGIIETVNYSQFSEESKMKIKAIIRFETDLKLKK